MLPRPLPLPLLLLLTACATQGTTGATATGNTDCRPPAEAVLPGTAGTLAETDTGSFCLPTGQRLTVFLTATGTAHWSAVTSSDPRVLAPAKAPLTAPVGVTPALFAANGPGTAQLTSQDGTGHRWQATIVVR
ncbi:hypothetical protein [Kitasatospora cathayae]|uniref:Lipoprotein n=1 Tax=Kitasatospora cathayae TaxID=3004092 RepID=A0ABY7Q0M0_9ACTN|nr:hypothetical protein [Kitasatospora sp. HUAS 3-15]WBP86165.1 hypothetical protein O1G21_10135 [Kitasatospora sp. HUAS 3-15]